MGRATVAHVLSWTLICRASDPVVATVAFSRLIRVPQAAGYGKIPILNP